MGRRPWKWQLSRASSTDSLKNPIIWYFHSRMFPAFLCGSEHRLPWLSQSLIMLHDHVIGMGFNGTFYQNQIHYTKLGWNVHIQGIFCFGMQDGLKLETLYKCFYFIINLVSTFQSLFHHWYFCLVNMSGQKICYRRRGIFKRMHLATIQTDTPFLENILCAWKCFFFNYKHWNFADSRLMSDKFN